MDESTRVGGNPSRRWRLLHETHCRLCPKGSPKAGVSSTSAHRRTRPQKHFREFGVAFSAFKCTPPLAGAWSLADSTLSSMPSQWKLAHCESEWTEWHRHQMCQGMAGSEVEPDRGWEHVMKGAYWSVLRATDLWPTAPIHDMAQYVINGIAIAEHSKVCL